MKTLLMSAFSIAAVLSPMPALSASPATTVPMHVEDALLDRELMARDLAYQLAPIKSEKDLHIYLAKNSGNLNPLRSLSKGAQQRFLQSLVFTDKGLASFDYSDLRVELTAAQIYQLLSVFGAQHSTKSIPGLRIVDTADMIIDSQGDDNRFYPATDYPDYKCERPATCVTNFSSICIGSNCHIP